MTLSVFLARLLGLYLLIVALDFLFRRKEIENAAKDFTTSKGLLLLSGSFSILAGLAIVIGHPVYTIDWRGLITLLGYVMIVTGCMRIGFPSRMQKRMGPRLHKGYWIIFAILVIIGIILTYAGFSS